MGDYYYGDARVKQLMQISNSRVYKRSREFPVRGASLKVAGQLPGRDTDGLSTTAPNLEQDLPSSDDDSWIFDQR